MRSAKRPATAASVPPALVSRPAGASVLRPPPPRPAALQADVDALVAAELTPEPEPVPEALAAAASSALWHAGMLGGLPTSNGSATATSIAPSSLLLPLHANAAEEPHPLASEHDGLLDVPPLTQLISTAYPGMESILERMG